MIFSQTDLRTDCQIFIVNAINSRTLTFKEYEELCEKLHAKHSFHPIGFILNENEKILMSEFNCSKEYSNDEKFIFSTCVPYKLEFISTIFSFTLKRLKPICSLLREYGFVFQKEESFVLKNNFERMKSLENSIFLGRCEKEFVEKQIFLDENGLYIMFHHNKHYLTNDDFEKAIIYEKE